MLRDLDKRRESDDEAIKARGLVLDYDEIVRKGSMTREEASISKWYGIYKSRAGCDHMIRVVNPGGRLTSVEARALADISEKYCPHKKISFTTRQSVQLHLIPLDSLPGFLRDIQKAGLTTFHGCGDVTRNVAACPWAGVCPHRRFDVLPYTKETAKLMSDSRDLDNLPRKFKITFSGCSGDCGQPHINCVGIVAVRRRRPDGSEENGFRVSIGGGLGWKPFIAKTVYSFVPPEQISKVCRAIAILFREHGDRYVRMYARLKFVVDRLGVEKCREILNGILDEEGVDRSRFEVGPVADCGAKVPNRPLRERHPVDSNGNSIQRIRIPKGELDASALQRIAELAEMYGDKHVYSTNRQNLEIHGVDPKRAPDLQGEIAKLGFGTHGFFGLEDVVTCVGTTYCPLAVTKTHDMFDLLQEVVHDEKYKPIRDKVTINLSGCPNSCGQFQIADIGLRGMRIREEAGSKEAYLVTVGGEEHRFGLPVGEYKKKDCVRVVRRILDTFLEMGGHNPHPADTLAEHMEKAGTGPYRNAIDELGIEYKKAANPLELSTFTGEGRKELDRKTLARDVPCQSACPAKTDVPAYIEHIAHGRFDEAYRINQEDNVMPGTLGRICTRPCETDCRYQWTSTRGAVRICHLKRSAADRKDQKAEPLPAYFGPSGKKVAVVGGGPAGLAAARELRRYGHAVTLIDREPWLGGQVRAGVPEFRLPRNVIEEDIRPILETGIDVNLNTRVDAEKLQRLIRDYDAAVVTIGANVPITLKLHGLEEGVGIEGLTFMRHYNDGEPIPVGEDVIIVGGGFTAVDCARASRRLQGYGGGNVSIMYRRGKAQMSATEEEFRALDEEDIRVDTLVAPVWGNMEDGTLESVTFCRTVLGEPDESGKPRFIPVPESEFEVPCDTLIFAIGQTEDRSVLPEGVKMTEGHRTSEERLFVAGDFCSGNGNAINAIADGKIAADEVDAFLNGGERRDKFIRVEMEGGTGRLRDHDLVHPPVMPDLPLMERFESAGDAERTRNAEVEAGYDRDDTDVHAWRCYLCNHKFEIDQDKCIHCDWCIRVSPRDCIRRLSHLELDEDGAPVTWTEVDKSEPEETTYIWIDSDNCIRCHNCINICPVDAISLRRLECVRENRE